MKKTIKTIEDLSLNAWPSWQMQVYDGWILRFSHFYTHRTNSVEQIGQSLLPLEEKVAYCEEIYRDWGTPCIFKIPPIGDPALDPYLERRGYHIEHATTVMTRDLDEVVDTRSERPGVDAFSNYSVEIGERVDERWLGAFFGLKGDVKAIHRKIVPNMYAAIPKRQVAVLVRDGGNVCGTGLGIVDRAFVGVYAIQVAPEYRRRGLATGIVETILREGRRNGASGAYLQVVSDNAAAKAVYRRLGFREYYRYYFRVK